MDTLKDMATRLFGARGRAHSQAVRATHGRPAHRSWQRTGLVLALAAVLAAPALPAAPVAADHPGESDPQERLQVILRRVQWSSLPAGVTGVDVTMIVDRRAVADCHPGAPSGADDICDSPTEATGLLTNANSQPNMDVPNSSLPFWHGDALRIRMQGFGQPPGNVNLGVYTQQYTEAGQWGMGTHNATIGPLSIQYEIRRGLHSDLQVFQHTVFDLGTYNPTLPLVAGEPTRICTDVYNFGNADAGPYHVHFFIDGVIPPPIGGEFHPTPSGLGLAQEADFCATTIQPLGAHQIYVSVDGHHSVPEIDEYNNRTAEETYFFTAPKPDLIASSIEVEGKDPDGNSDCDPGKNLVTAIIYNKGYADAGPFVARLLVDDDDPKDDEEFVTALARDAQTIATFFKIKMKKGTHLLRVTVDADSEVDEYVEDNNIAELTINCIKEDDGDDDDD